MPGRRNPLPKKGDKKLSAEFLREMSERLDRFDKLTTGQLPMSSGPAGIAIPYIEPDQPAPLTIVEHGWLPAAFGGTYGRFNTGDKSRELGNFVDSNDENTGTRQRRLMYPRSHYQLTWNDSGLGKPASLKVDTNKDTLRVYNPFGLPLEGGLSYAAPMDAEKFQYLILQPLTPQWGPIRFIWTPGHAYPTESKVYIDNTQSGNPTGRGKLLQTWGTGENNSFSGSTFSYAHTANGDIFLPYPGAYRVTFGFSSTADPSVLYFETGSQTGNTPIPAVVASHAHEIDRLRFIAPRFAAEILINREAGEIGNPASSGSERPEKMAVEYPIISNSSLSGSAFGQAVGEKTFILYTDTDAEHGGHYTRLSFSVGFTANDTLPGYDVDAWHGIVEEAYVIVEPITTWQVSEWGGADVWPGGYLQSNSLSPPYFQWWGLDPAQPIRFNPDGTEYES